MQQYTPSLRLVLEAGAFSFGNKRKAWQTFGVRTHYIGLGGLGRKIVKRLSLDHYPKYALLKDVLYGVLI